MTPGEKSIRKRLNDLRRNPSNRRASEIVALLKAVGATESKKSGSHHVFKHKRMLPLTVVYQSDKDPLRTETVLDKVQWVEELLDKEEAAS